MASKIILKKLLTFQKSCFIFFNESLIKMMKNAFYFISKALFVLLTFWPCGKKAFIRKISLISIFMTSKPG